MDEPTSPTARVTAETTFRTSSGATAAGSSKTGQFLDPGKTTNNKLHNTLITAAIRDKSADAVNSGKGTTTGIIPGCSLDERQARRDAKIELSKRPLSFKDLEACSYHPGAARVRSR